MPRWIFGYGSLVWRVGFPHVEQRPAFVEGWVRRFWQGSVDHRGVPSRPGRVVTLVPEPGARCFGVAYRLPENGGEEILERLDHRERGGYRRLELELHFPGAPEERPVGLAWVATPENPNYLGPAPLEHIAQQVREAHGPSGPNPEYVLRLAEFLRRHDAPDEHVFALERLLRQGPRREA